MVEYVCKTLVLVVMVVVEAAVPIVVLSNRQPPQGGAKRELVGSVLQRACSIGSGQAVRMQGKGAVAASCTCWQSTQT